MYFNNVERNGLRWRCHRIDWFHPLCSARVWPPPPPPLMSFPGWHLNDRLWADFAVRRVSRQCSAIIMVNAHCAVCLVGSNGILSLHMPCYIKGEPAGGSKQMLSGCFVLSQSGLFGSEVISTRNNIMTHFNVVARSVGWQTGEMRSSLDMWKWGSYVFVFKIQSTASLKSNIHFISHFFFSLINCIRAEKSRSIKTQKKGGKMCFFVSCRHELSI